MKKLNSINFWFLIPSLLAAFGLSAPGALGGHEIPTSEKATALIGTGYDSDKDTFIGKCVDGKTVLEGKPESTIDFQTSITQSELANELGFAIGARARVNIIQFSASAKFMNASKEDSYSISSVYSGTYTFKNRILKDEVTTGIGKRVSSDPAKWRRVCGDEYVHQQTLGAKIYFSIRIDFGSAQEKNAFSANFNIAGPLFSVGGEIAKAKSLLSKNTRITINALQVGGKVDQLTGIFYGHEGEAGGTEPSFMFVKCSLGDFQKCESVLARAIDYATNRKTGFPSQIRPDHPGGDDGGGPAVLINRTQSYDYLGFENTIPSEVNQQVELARRRLSDLFEDNYLKYTAAGRLTKNGTVRLSPHQKNLMLKTEATLYRNLMRASDGIAMCFKAPIRCTQVYDALIPGNPSGGGLEIVPESRFVIAPQVFAQYCDLAYSPLSGEALAKTVKVMVGAAKVLDPDAFKPQFEGHQVDTCFVADTILGRQTRLDLSHQKIQDLRPLGTLLQLTHLNLSGNDLKDISELSKLSSLISLELNDNQLADVSTLASLRNLEALNLSDNRISNAGILRTLERLRMIDLRNNERGIQCPFEDISRCLIADYRNNNSFVELPRFLTSPRIGHRAIGLDGGAVFLIGGNNSQRAELFDPQRGSFDLLKGKVAQRMSHALTKLSDGRVLISGGWGSLRQLDVYDPQSGGMTSLKQRMMQGRASHTSTLLKDGRVLIVGGWRGSNGFWTGADPTSGAEIFDSGQGRLIEVGTLNLPRASHRATLLNDGRVLITGGLTLEGGLPSAELFDPVQNTFTRLNSRMRYGRGNHEASLLQDGRVLITGGFIQGLKAVNRAEIFDPATLLFSDVESEMIQGRGDHTATVLENGRVLVAGGRTDAEVQSLDSLTCMTCVDTAEIFDPVISMFTVVGQKMHHPRAIHSATPLPGYRVLIVGGLGEGAGFSAEVFEYSSNFRQSGTPGLSVMTN